LSEGEAGRSGPDYGGASPALRPPAPAATLRCAVRCSDKNGAVDVQIRMRAQGAAVSKDTPVQAPVARIE
jgi:hypothetical protein